MSWQKILKKRQATGMLMQVNGKMYRFHPDAYNEYLAVVERMKQNPRLREYQNAIPAIAKRKIVQQFNLQPGF